jgi:hypothetical protein
MTGAINYTVVTDTSADWTSVANSTYFYDKVDKLVHYKDSTGVIQEIFSQSASAVGITGEIQFNNAGAFAANSALFWDNTNKRLGVGVNSNTPTAALQVRTNTTTAHDLLQISNGLYGNNIFRIRDNATSSQGSIGSVFIQARIYGSNSTITGNEFDLGGYGLGTSYGQNGSNAVWLNNQGNIGDGAGTSVISVSSNVYINLQTTKKYKFEAVTGNFGIGNVGTLGARLDVSAQGALSTDIAFRVRNSVDTRDIVNVRGNKTIELIADTPATNGGISITASAYNEPIINMYDNFGSKKLIIDTPNALIGVGGSGNIKIGSLTTTNSYLGLVTPTTNNRFLKLVDAFNNEYLSLGGNAYDGGGGISMTLKTTTTNGTNFVTFSRSNNTNPVVISDLGYLGVGTATAAARLDIRAQGALSTDIAFRVRNSVDDRNLFSILGNGDIEVRTNRVSIGQSTRLSIGGSNVDNGLDASNYTENAIVGFNNTNSGRRTTIIGSSNTNNNGVNPCTTIGYGNSNRDNGVVVGHSNALGGIVLGSSNTGGSVGRTAVIGDSNIVSEPNGNPTLPMFLLGNGVTIPNNSVVNNCVFLSAGNNSTAPFNTFKNDNLLIGSLTPWTANFDNSSRGVFYTKNGTAPTTLAADTFGMYSADIVAGNAAPHFRTENGNVIKLYKQDLPTHPTNVELATFLSNLGLANLI